MELISFISKATFSPGSIQRKNRDLNRCTVPDCAAQRLENSLFCKAHSCDFLSDIFKYASKLPKEDYYLTPSDVESLNPNLRNIYDYSPGSQLLFEAFAGDIKRKIQACISLVSVGTLVSRDKNLGDAVAMNNINQILEKYRKNIKGSLTVEYYVATLVPGQTDYVPVKKSILIMEKKESYNPEGMVIDVIRDHLDITLECKTVMAYFTLALNIAMTYTTTGTDISNALNQFNLWRHVSDLDTIDKSPKQVEALINMLRTTLNYYNFNYSHISGYHEKYDLAILFGPHNVMSAMIAVTKNDRVANNIILPMIENIKFRSKKINIHNPIDKSQFYYHLSDNQVIMYSGTKKVASSSVDDVMYNLSTMPIAVILTDDRTYLDKKQYRQVGRIFSSILILHPDEHVDLKYSEMMDEVSRLQVVS